MWDLLEIHFTGKNRKAEYVKGMRPINADIHIYIFVYESTREIWLVIKKENEKLGFIKRSVR